MKKEEFLKVDAESFELSKTGEVVLATPERAFDSVERPSYYNFGKYEVIEVIEDWQLGYHLGNAVKYIARAGKKDPEKTEEDLRKAVWYIERFKRVINENNKFEF